MEIVIWPPLPDDWVSTLRKAAGDAELRTPRTEAEALAAAPESDGWIGRLTPALLAAAPRLRWLQAPSISLERFVFPELVDSPVTLTHYRHIFDDHISNHIMAMFLALCRGLPRLMHRQAERRWSPGDMVVRDPAEMTVLVLGLGGIGAEAAQRLSVLGCYIIGVDPRVEDFPPGVEAMARPKWLGEILPRCDAVIVCAPHTPETEGMFDDEMFGQMKPGTLFINIGRGKIVRLAALERALEEGRVGGAGLDVFETEPLPPDSPLWAMENVILTPHVAGEGLHVGERQLAVLMENIGRFVSGRELLYVADKARWY